MILSTYFVGQTLESLASLQNEIDQIQTMTAWRRRELSKGLVDELQPEEHDENVDQYEFVLASLVTLNKIAYEDIRPIMDKYRELANPEKGFICATEAKEKATEFEIDDDDNNNGLKMSSVLNLVTGGMKRGNPRKMQRMGLSHLNSSFFFGGRRSSKAVPTLPQLFGKIDESDKDRDTGNSPEQKARARANWRRILRKPFIEAAQTEKERKVNERRNRSPTNRTVPLGSSDRPPPRAADDDNDECSTEIPNELSTMQNTSLAPTRVFGDIIPEGSNEDEESGDIDYFVIYTPEEFHDTEAPWEEHAKHYQRRKTATQPG